MLCALVALSYLLFAAFVVVALRSGAPISSCGCFGKADTPPSVVHVVLDLLFAGVATAAAFTGDVALPDVLGDQPLLGVIAHNMPDMWLHVAIAVVTLWLGFGMRDEPAVTAS